MPALGSREGCTMEMHMPSRRGSGTAGRANWVVLSPGYLGTEGPGPGP